LGQVGAVAQVLPHAPVVGPEEFLEHQAGEELVLGKLLGAKTMTVGRQGALRNLLRDLQHASGRLAGGAHP
jgi:hypothetical protein